MMSVISHGIKEFTMQHVQKHRLKYKIYINQKYEINWGVVKTIHLNSFTYMCVRVRVCVDINFI